MPNRNDCLKDLDSMLQDLLIYPLPNSQKTFHEVDVTLIEEKADYALTIHHLAAGSSLIFKGDSFPVPKAIFKDNPPDIEYCCRPDYIIFTCDQKGKPYTIIIELAKSNRSKSKQHVIHQLKGGNSICAYLAAQLKNFKATTLNSFLDRIIYIQNINETRRQTTKPQPQKLALVNETEFPFYKFYGKEISSKKIENELLQGTCL